MSRDSEADAMRVAHRLRGIAGSIGLDTLGDTAGELEERIRDGASSEEWRELANALLKALRDIRVGTAPTDAPVEEAPPVEVLRPTVHSDLPLRDFRVLAVEDDTQTRHLLELSLGTLGGARARVVEDPEQALRILGQGWDLLLLDAMLPGTDGQQVARRARAIRPDITIAFLSAADRERLDWNSPEPWLSKPFRPAALVRALAEILGKSKSASDARRPDRTMKKPLCLIGMSGIGKSFWSKRLASSGWTRHDCDGLIGEKLSSLIAVSDGEEPVHALGRWMGHPWTDGFAERQQKYLELEERITRDVLERLEPYHVFDTTGSVVNLSASLKDDLRDRCQVVYLATPRSHYDRMLRRYLEEPKPVVWGEIFERDVGEPPDQALPRCYRKLLELRDRWYRELAHVTLDGSELESTDPGVRGFLELCEGERR